MKPTKMLRIDPDFEKVLDDICYKYKVSKVSATSIVARWYQEEKEQKKDENRFKLKI